LNTKLKTLSALIIVSLLNGCSNDERTLFAICDDTPQICQDIATNGWCKTERGDVIRHREQELLAPLDETILYSGLKKWKNLSQCIEIAANIKRRKLKDRDPIKQATFLVTLQEIARIEQETKHSQIPELLYYHWAQDGEPQKLATLMRLDDQGKLNNTSMQLIMATLYAKTDKQKAINTQYKALSLLTKHELDNLPISLYAGFATYFYQAKRYQLSYVWAQVAVKAGLKENKSTALRQKIAGQNADIDALDDLAHTTYRSIQALAFKAPDNKIQPSTL